MKADTASGEGIIFVPPAEGGLDAAGDVFSSFSFRASATVGEGVRNVVSRRTRTCAFFWLLLRPCCCFVAEGVARASTDEVLRRVDTFSDARGMRVEDDLRPEAEPNVPIPPVTLWRAREAAAVEEADLEADAAGRDPRRESAKWLPLAADEPSELLPVVCCCCCSLFFFHSSSCLRLSAAASRAGGGAITGISSPQRIPRHPSRRPSFF